MTSEEAGIGRTFCEHTIPSLSIFFFARFVNCMTRALKCGFTWHLSILRGAKHTEKLFWAHELRASRIFLYNATYSARLVRWAHGNFKKLG